MAMMLVRGCVLAALAACGATATSVTPPEPTPAPAASSPPADQGTAAAQKPHQHDDSLTGVIDQPAPPWQVSQWFNSPPLSLEQLRGKVVLVRWFMGP